MYISEIKTGAPTDVRCPLERRMYETLDKLRIPYERVDNDPVSETWRSVQRWTKFLELKSGKMCSYVTRKRQTFFLLVMPANKSFDTAAFSKKLGVSHMVICTAGENA